MYYAMVRNLQEQTEDNPDPRGDLDRWLETGLWSTPDRRGAFQDVEREPGAPSWWHGDEEASQSFFKSMNIDPMKWGAR